MTSDLWYRALLSEHNVAGHIAVIGEQFVAAAGFRDAHCWQAEEARQEYMRRLCVSGFGAVGDPNLLR
jgi:hypothetical protein